MKLRINRDLHARARACAEAVGDSLSRWISLALRQYMCGKKLNDITPDPALLAADQDAMVITIPQLPAASPAIRRAIAAAVIYCEARNPRPFKTHLTAGRDYIIAKPAE